MRVNNIKRFDNPKAYNKYRRENRNYLTITDGLGAGYIVRDRFGMLTTENGNLWDIDDFNRLDRKYNYKEVEGLRELIGNNQDRQFIFMGTEQFENKLLKKEL